MTTQPTDPAPGPTWGAAPGTPAPTEKKPWSGRKTAIAAGVAVVIAAGGGLAIWAGTSSGDTSTRSGPGGPGAPGGPGGQGGFGGRAGGFGGAAALRGALHGDFVVADPSGGYVTERLQTGAASELSATSVTLTSKDGYKQTYTIDSSTRKTGEVESGADLTVVAKVDGTTATATTLGEAAAVQPGEGPGGGQGQPGQGRRRYGS
ncbi:hypothetical protein [Amycolatopsis sp. PS_44_ISF1]|uniref:hypothetical protein n=1 Tax=Amycolatopsis sp. PS_44_ISF1 TaxID=2974917 RepID=UPI0028DEF582|nr:hypothetical protein [Amycolatopsis sp. PS_44_ISF1]MDT8910796.1 hypothetical protein [Amycolatopsis sp. PS_44_ISF1]